MEGEVNFLVINNVDVTIEYYSSTEQTIIDYEVFLVFLSQKPNKLQRIPLNKSAQLFISDKILFKGIYGEEVLFAGNYSDEFINRELKDICKIAGINKSVSFHVSRHTFATNFLISGGKIEVLQKLLGHSKIETTMIYVHIAESITDVQILNMDTILSN